MNFSGWIAIVLAVVVALGLFDKKSKKKSS